MYIEGKRCCNPLANLLTNDMLQLAFSGLHDVKIGTNSSGSVHTIEHCSLRTFIRDGKKGKYSSQFLCCINNVDELDNMMQLNFTHRSAFGSFGEGDEHGSLSDLADSELAKLMSKYPTVFSEPVYPVSRGEEIDRIF